MVVSYKLARQLAYIRRRFCDAIRPPQPLPAGEGSPAAVRRVQGGLPRAPRPRPRPPPPDLGPTPAAPGRGPARGATASGQRSQGGSRGGRFSAGFPVP